VCVCVCVGGGSLLKLWCVWEWFVTHALPDRVLRKLGGRGLLTDHTRRLGPPTPHPHPTQKKRRRLP
jgi:hypothetical protein